MVWNFWFLFKILQNGDFYLKNDALAFQNEKRGECLIYAKINSATKSAASLVKKICFTLFL